MNTDFSAGQLSGQPQRYGMDGVTDRGRDAVLNTYIMRLADTMLLLARELAETTDSQEIINLRRTAALIEDTKKAAELSQELIARKLHLK